MGFIYKDRNNIKCEKKKNFSITSLKSISLPVTFIVALVSYHENIRDRIM